MSVHKSLRRIAKNSYIKSINELSKYAYSRTIALDIDNKLNKEYQDRIIYYTDVIMERSFIATSRDITVNSDIFLCDNKIHYLNQTKDALSVLSKYMSFLLSIMFDRNIWIKGDKKYTLKVFQRFASMIVDAEDSIDLNIQYINKCKEAKIKGITIQKDNNVCTQVSAKLRSKKKSGKRGGKKIQNKATI